MLAPILRKIIENKKVLIERSLPNNGNLFVQPGDVLEPFNKLGDCLYSPHTIFFPKTFEPVKYMREKVYFKKGSYLGKIGSNKINAETDGYMNYSVEAEEYFFEEMPFKFTLLSGLWGTVKDIQPDRSVLIDTTVTEIDLVACTKTFSFGELVVFPNPTEILGKFYLESFIKTTKDKVVYVGHYADLETIKKAHDLGICSLIAGSADPAGFAFAKSIDIGLGVLSGFGKLETPTFLYALLNSVAYRHVFFHGDLGVLRIPMSGENVPTKKSKSPLKVIKKVAIGQKVQVMQKPHFGKIGTIDRVSDLSIFVRFDNELGPVEIDLPNFYIIE